MAAAKKASKAAKRVVKASKSKAVRAKAGKDFQERQKVFVGGDALTGARKVYLFIQVAF